MKDMIALIAGAGIARTNSAANSERRSLRQRPERELHQDGTGPEDRGRYAALGVSCEIVFRDGEQITVYGSIMGTLSPPPNDQTSDNGSSCYPAFPARARRRLGTNSRNWRALQSVGRAS